MCALSGKILQVKGSVTLQERGKSPVEAASGSAVYERTVIKTGLRSSATLLIGGTVTRIAQLSRISVGSLSSQKGNTPEAVNLNLRRGKLRALIKKIQGKRVSFKVRTPVSVASVRGSEVEISHGPSFGTMLRFISGFGDFANQSRTKREMKKGQKSRTNGINLPSNDLWENKVKFTLPVFSSDLSFLEKDSIFNLDEITLDTHKSDAVYNYLDFMKESKKTKVRIHFSLP
jgi:hypothetical protein